MPHLLVLHRWQDEFVDYAAIVDHGVYDVTYITTEHGVNSLPPAGRRVVVADTGCFDEVCAVADEVVEHYGRPERIVALSEADLDVAAQLRDRFGTKGLGVRELSPYRDKLYMLRQVAAAGVPVPAFAAASGRSDVVAFSAEHPWPLIVKPRSGSASRGVVRLDSPGDLHRVPETLSEPSLVQVYVAAPVVHVDGVWTSDGLGPWRAARYVNTCYDFAGGQPLGSVEIDDRDLLEEIAACATRALGAFAADTWVFHLELFAGGSASTREVVFLEVGNRVGGAEIPFVWREVHGYDLMAAAVAIQLGHEPPVHRVAPGDQVGGWLLAPVLGSRPCRVTHASPLARDIDLLYAEVVPAVGTTIPAVGGYEHVGGRFRFRGPTSEAVEAAVVKAADAYAINVEAVGT